MDIVSNMPLRYGEGQVRWDFPKSATGGKSTDNGL
jgi:hypothetical protein